MLTSRIAAALSASLAASLIATTAFAQTTTAPGSKSGGVAGVTTTSSTAGIGQNLDFCLASNASTAPLINLTYPGDNSSLVVDSSMTNLISGDTSSVGFLVFDSANGSNPVETANLGNNQAHSNPTQIELAYSSGNSGAVQLRPFNYSSNNVCFTVTPVQLPNGVSSLSLSGAGATRPPTASPLPQGSISPLPSTPVSSKSAGIGQSLSFCLAPNASSAPAVTLNYPGDSTNLVVNSGVTGLAAGDTTSAGFNVFDTANGNTPVETANLANNEFNGNPQLIQFAYSAATGGQVHLRPFNASPNQVCFDLSPIQLPSGVSAVVLA